MQQEIPNIAFKAAKESKNKSNGIDIITLKDLIIKQQGLTHSPEKAHQLEFNMIVLYTKGESKQLIDFVEYDVNTNTIVYLSKGQINAFRFNDTLDGYIILFTADYLNKQLHRLPQFGIINMFASSLFSPKITIQTAANIIKYIELFHNEFYNEQDSFNQSNILNDLFSIIISKLGELKHNQTKHITSSHKLEQFMLFKSLVEANYNISRNAQFYASKLNMTYKHLNSVCKEVMHITAKNFIDDYIILTAKRKLINSKVKSNELAFLMGFTEPTNFVKYFKKETGLTPNQFKKKHN